LIVSVLIIGLLFLLFYIQLFSYFLLQVCQ